MRAHHHSAEATGGLLIKGSLLFERSGGKTTLVRLQDHFQDQDPTAFANGADVPMRAVLAAAGGCDTCDTGAVARIDVTPI